MTAEMLPLLRIPRRDRPSMVPRPVLGETGLFIVDATWGTISPMSLAPGVECVGELEVIAHIEQGLPLVDTRPADRFLDATIPTARNVPHAETRARLASFDPEVPTVLFCNGPQCAATPDAVASLLAGGHPADSLRYYRGGLHDWITLGLPVVRP